MKTSEHILTGMDTTPWRAGERAERREYGPPLRVTELSQGLHEQAEGIKDRFVYRLSWRRTGRGSHTGTYVKLSPEHVRLTPEASRIYDEARAASQVEETAVFLSTRFGGSRIELVLAAREDVHWSALHEWSDTWRRAGLSRHDIAVF